MPPSINRTPVERELDILFSDLRSAGPGTDKYATILDRIAKLHKLKVEETPPRVSPDTLILAGANLLGIVLILNHERLNIVTTKAMSLLPRPR